MSRIGKNPVAIPQGVTVDLAGQTLTAKGRLGTLSLVVSNDVTATVADGAVTIAPKDDSKRARAMWGTTRALVNNMVTGVSAGFTRNLEINGVGYRAAVQGSNLNLQLGYSHDISLSDPAGRQDHLPSGRPRSRSAAPTASASGRSRARSARSGPPEPYKGKGIKYSDETIRRKEGKKK